MLLAAKNTKQPYSGPELTGLYYLLQLFGFRMFRIKIYKFVIMLFSKRCMPVRFFFLLVFFFLSQVAFSQYRGLLNKTFAERYIALDTIFYANNIFRLDSTAMARELSKVETLAKKHQDAELELEVRLIGRVYDLVGLQQNHRRGEAGLLALREEADEKEIRQLQIRVREKLAYFYFHIAHKYGPAFENYLAYYKFLKTTPPQDFPPKQELIANIGSAYFLFGDNLHARRYFAEAQQEAPSYKKRFPINLQNTLGLIYRTEKHYERAEQYFRKAYAMAEANQDSTWMGIAAGNIGITYFQQKKYAEALPLLELDVRQSMQAHEMDNALSSLIIIMKIKARQGAWQQVEARLPLAWQLFPLTGSPEMHRRELYAVLAKKNAAAGNFKLAYHYADSSAIIRDTLFNRRNTVLLTRIEQKAEIEKHRSEMQALEIQKRFQNWLLFGLAVGIVLLFIIAALVFNRQRLVYQQRQQWLRAEKEHIEHELQQASAKLKDFTTRIREKNKLIEGFTAEMDRLQAHNGIKETDGQQGALERLQQATILTEEQWEEFREIFETVHRGYLQRLKHKVPGLSPAETRFMVLNKLELSNKEMAATLGVSPEAIRQTRHRLRKKLETTLNLNLEELSSSI